MLVEAYNFVTPWAKAKKYQIIKNRILSKMVSGSYMLLHKVKHVKDNDNPKCDAVVSLTSFPARIDGLYYCLCSLLNQIVRPKRLVLWLAKEQFPNKLNSLPRRICELQDVGLEIKFCNDIKSYKKIVYMAQEAVNENIIIVDDDTLYPEDWLKRIWDESTRYPDSVICYRAHEIGIDNGIIEPYDKWNKLAPGIKGPSKGLMPIGVGGVLYPKRCFENVEWDYNAIHKCAPTTDDIWLKCLITSRGYKIIKVDADSVEWFTVLGTQKQRLAKMNVEMGNANDIALKKCMQYFGLIPADFSQSEMMHDK